jgi:hypothetical protein
MLQRIGQWIFPLMLAGLMAGMEAAVAAPAADDLGFLAIYNTGP